MIGHALQSGIGLPDRDYYLGRDKKSKELRKQYVNMLCRMFELIGEKPTVARRHAEAVLIGTDAAGHALKHGGRRNDTLTALTALAIVEKVLAGQLTPGFQTPSLAYGPDLIMEIEGVERVDEE